MPKKNKDLQNVTFNDCLYVVELDDIQEYAVSKKYSSVFNKVKTIIFETNKESLFGPGFKFFPFDNYLFILDKNHTKNLLIFDREGKFIKKIGNLGRGPGEYARVYDFTIDPENQIIYLLCDSYINEYSIDGTYIGGFSLNHNASSIQYANGKLYTELRGGKYLLQEIDPKTKMQNKKYLETAQYNKGWNEPSYFYEGGPFKHRSVECPKFVDLFMDTIFVIHQNGIIPFLSINSRHLTSNSDVKATQGMIPNDRIDAIRNKNKVFCIYNYFETRNHIYFFYKHGNTIFPILYDLYDNSYQKAFLENDLVFNNTEIFNFPNFIYSDFNGVYESFDSPYTYELFLDWVKEGKLAHHVDKRDQLMKINEDSNPVIFYYSYDDEE